MTPYLDFGRRLHAVRRRRGFSQQQVADFMTISKMMISKWESGQLRTHPFSIEKLSAAYCVPVKMWEAGELRWDEFVVGLHPTTEPGSSELLPVKPAVSFRRGLTPDEVAKSANEARSRYMLNRLRKRPCPYCGSVDDRKWLRSLDLCWKCATEGELEDAPP